MNVEKAIGFVEKNGTELEKCRLNYLLGKERDDEIPLRYLRELQNDDGGFPYNNEKGKLSSVNSTSGNLSLIIELGLTTSEVCRKTIKYLLSAQGEDGSWDEDPTINQYNPPFWNMPGDLKTNMWLTASTVNDLTQLGYRKSEAVKKAIQFLLKNRDAEGKFFGFLHSTWLSVGVFGQLEGPNSEFVKKALKVIERNIDRLQDNAGDLAWCLGSFYVAGISREHPLVKKCIERVIKLQADDGAWISGAEDAHPVSTTISVLKVLKMFRIW